MLMSQNLYLSVHTLGVGTKAKRSPGIGIHAANKILLNLTIAFKFSTFSPFFINEIDRRILK